MGFPEMIRTLEYYGVSDVLLPFILVFTIVFAVMQKTKVLGEKKNYNVIVSLVLALGVVIPHVLGTYPPGGDVVDILNSVLPNISLALVAILMVMIMLGIWGANINIAGSSVGGWIMILSIVFVFGLFGSAVGWINLDWLRLSPEAKSLITIILVFGIIISYITKEDQPEKDAGFGQRIGDMFGKLLNK